MPVTSVMMLDGESDMIRCRFICDWFRKDSRIPNKEGILTEIERGSIPMLFSLISSIFHHIRQEFYIFVYLLLQQNIGYRKKTIKVFSSFLEDASYAV